MQTGNAAVKLFVLELCKMYCSGYYTAMYQSITENLSYEKTLMHWEIPINRNDFYAYRRRIVAEIRNQKEKEQMEELKKEIIELLEKADERKIRLVLEFVRGLLK